MALHKSAKFVKVFSLESFPLYGTQHMYIHRQSVGEPDMIQACRHH